MNAPTPGLDHALRRGRITSSRVAACLGIDPWKSPLQAWLEITGREPEPETNEVMDRGRRLEDALLQYAADQHGWTWRKPGTIGHPEHSWAADSADAEFLDGDDVVAIGEGKTVNARMIDSWGTPGTAEVPDYVTVQSLWHLWHRQGVARCVVPILGGYDMTFEVYEVRRDEEAIGVMVEGLARWHRNFVLGDRAPKADHRDGPTLDRLFRAKSQGKLLDDPGLWVDVESVVLGAIAAKEARDDADQQYETLRAALRELLQGYDGAKGDGWSVSYREQKGRAVVNWRAIVDEMDVPPELYQKHTRLTPSSRSLRITGPRKTK